MDYAASFLAKLPGASRRDHGMRQLVETLESYLPGEQIDALMVVGQALLKSSPKLEVVAEKLALSGVEDLPDLAQACAAVAAAGEG